MNHLDLCTGIGGFHLAAGWAGFRTIGFSEIEPYCCQLLADKWPEIHNYGDIRRADFSGLRGRITVCSAGVPCQPASLAGKRRGASDDRWLWETVLDVVRTVEPAWIVFENPPGILSLGEFDGVLLRLGALGYQVRAFSVPANAVGAKHRRQRMFIVANAASEVRQQEASWSNGHAAQRGETLADADNSRLQGRDSGELRERTGQRIAGQSSSYWRHDFRLTEPPLCLRTDGVSCGLDGTPIRNRGAQLKALGNAVVPQQAWPFFAAIAQVEKARWLQ